MIVGWSAPDAGALLYFQLPACAIVSLCIMWLCRAVARRDPVLGWIVQVGVLLRLWAGLALFLISYLKLPVLRSLYLGDGFWQLAPDARSYFWGATIAAEEGFHTVAAWSPSPVFVKVLALWMRMVGTSPASAVLLNACSYVGIVGVLVALIGADRSRIARNAVLLPVMAFTFSPALLVFGTQALKDQFFALLLVAICGAAWLGFRALHAVPSPHVVGSRMAFVLAGAGLVYLTAGIRPYVAFLVVTLVAALLAAGARTRTAKKATIHLATSALVVALLWVSFKAGAEAYYLYYESAVLSTVGITPSAAAGIPGGAILAAREGFVLSGGGTNLKTRIKHVEGASLPRRMWEYSADLVLGLVVIFVPISVARWLSLVQFDGGRGLLLMTDIDTVFIEVTLVAIILFLRANWKSPRLNVEYMMFTGSLCVLLTALMAFVVTNYGSLFRLRLVAAALMWLLPLAVVRAGVNLPGGARVGARHLVGATPPASGLRMHDA